MSIAFTLGQRGWGIAQYLRFDCMAKDTDICDWRAMEELLATVYKLSSSSIAGVLVGGLISLLAQHVGSRASLRIQRQTILLNEKLGHYYQLADLLVDLDSALKMYAAAPIRKGEVVTEEEAKERDSQGVKAIAKIERISEMADREYKKILVIGSKGIAQKLADILEKLEEYQIKSAENAVYKNGLFEARLHYEYVDELKRSGEQLIKAMNEELAK